MGCLTKEDRAWLERVLAQASPVGHCGESSSEAIGRGRIEDRVDRIRDALNALDTPEVEDFAKGVVSEAQHQRARWGVETDAGKGAFDWFWLIGFLAQKAASAAVAGDVDKAKHHTISTAAALANWHANLDGTNAAMRPGIAAPAADAVT